MYDDRLIWHLLFVSQNLALFPFNNSANIATSDDGWYVDAGVVVDGLGGNDKITGTSIRDAGIDNEGTINTGEGDDTITGTSIRDAGIDNDGTINTGEGDDKITGTSIRDYGIDNDGTINTGKGDDTITGTSIRYEGIYNEGTINTGKGSDVVNALEGRFGGNGDTYLGGGSDTIKGFGTGNFYGGNGIDKMLFCQGTYTVSGSIIVSDGMKMNVNEFESIGGANGGCFALKDGTLTVDSAGVGTFA